MHETLVGPAVPHGHVEGVEDELGAQMRRHRPANDAPAERVDHHREIQPPFDRPLLRDVGDPEPIGAGRTKVALNEILGWQRAEITAGETTSPPATVGALETGLTHQTGDSLTTAADAMVEAQLDMDPGCPRGASRPFPDLFDRRAPISSSRSVKRTLVNCDPDRARALLSAAELPRELRLVDGIPRTGSGKIRRAELRALTAGGSHAPRVWR